MKKIIEKLIETKERRAILIAGVVILLIGVAYRFYPAMRDIVFVGEEMTVKKQQLRKYRQVALDRDVLNKHVISLNRNLERLQTGLLEASSVSLAAVNIQNMLSEIAEKAGTDIEQARVLKAEETENKNYLNIAVQFMIRVHIDGLNQILYELESSPKYLTVDKLTITSHGKADIPELRVDMVVSGIMRKT